MSNREAIHDQYYIDAHETDVLRRPVLDVAPLAMLRKNRQLLAIGALAVLSLSAGKNESDINEEAFASRLSVSAELAPVETAEEAAPEPDYAPLLDLISQGESNGNYNAYYGEADNTSINFTEMSVSAVLQWQSQYVGQGSPSSAVGRYQFIQPTLTELVETYGIDGNAVFDERLQDELAVRLLEKRGLSEYLEGQISKEEFAHNLSKEWAALPQAVGPDPDAGFYDGDGLNQAHITAEEIYRGIDSLQQ